MEIKKCMKKSFSIIGKEGSTNDGTNFIERLWSDANSHFNEVSELAKRDEKGNLIGLWGAMSDLSHSFKPWEDNFSKGLYLSGVEVTEDAQAPEGWVKWTIPSYEYLYVKRENSRTFANVITYFNENNIQLAGAVHEFNCPETGHGYLFFPIRKL